MVSYEHPALFLKHEDIRGLNHGIVKAIGERRGHVLGAGHWLDAQQGNRDKAVAIAAGRKFFNQDPKILEFVMENPTDRVTYGDLRMIRAEFDDLMQLSVQAGTITHPIAYETYVDETFAQHANPAQIIL